MVAKRAGSQLQLSVEVSGDSLLEHKPRSKVLHPFRGLAPCGIVKSVEHKGEYSTTYWRKTSVMNCKSAILYLALAFHINSSNRGSCAFNLEYASMSFLADNRSISSITTAPSSTWTVGHSCASPLSPVSSISRKAGETRRNCSFCSLKSVGISVRLSAEADESI